MFVASARTDVYAEGTQNYGNMTTFDDVEDCLAAVKAEPLCDVETLVRRG